MIIGDQGRLDTHFDRAGLFMKLDDRQQFDGVTELLGKGDVLAMDVFDTFHMDFVAGNPASVA